MWKLPQPRIPSSTYRLQFNHRFKFADAKAIIPYLHSLGITDIYSSPYLKAQKESLHGYDIVDPNALNPEIGTEGDYDELIKELNKYGMGQVIDIVPNHMCITSMDNVWWMDLLENGPSSLYARFFDIDWNPLKKELNEKVLLPILGSQYGRVLENQELKLTFEEGAFFINYFTHKFPIIPKTYIHILQHRIADLEKLLSPDNPGYGELLSIITAINHLPPYTERDSEKIAERYREKEIIKRRLWSLYSENPAIRGFIDENLQLFNGNKGERRSFDLLDRLITEQSYRLSYWQVATDEINYRRFFDINSLVSIRMEDPVVFNESHKLIFRLIGEGKVTGLRVDHPDGLYNPSEYFRQLQRNCFLRLQYLKQEESDLETEALKFYEEALLSNPHYKPFYIVGEKILAIGEKMPEDWQIFSTTGYVFMNLLNGIFVAAGNAKSFDDIYTGFIGSRVNFNDIVYEKKRQIMQVAMSSEINTLGHYLDNLSEKDRHTRDFTLNSLTATIIETIAFFPVYRTYINSYEIREMDRRYIEIAVSRAKRKNPAVSESIFNFLKDILLLNFPKDFEEKDKKEWLDFVMRFQQITGPVMAKGLEDTAFYTYNRLVSLNEVGGTPDRFGISIDEFHAHNIERCSFWPHALIATSTHDSKRSEDVRARINVLSEIPDKWNECLIKWSGLNREKKAANNNQPVPDDNEEYLLYQTLIGAYPLGQMNDAEYEGFKKRIKDYMLKAIREAKVNTSWINPNINYENAMMNFIDVIMNPAPENRFLMDFEIFQKPVSYYGMYNSLSQTLLKIASPGVPDFYQGSEIWDFSLVDPDNRRPVDYRKIIKMLDDLKRIESEAGALRLAGELAVNKDNGMIKLYLIYKALNCRMENREIFEMGEYIPVNAAGKKTDNVCSFVRKFKNRSVIAAAPRFYTKLVGNPENLPCGKRVWEDSFIIVPPGRYRNIFTGEGVTAKRHEDTYILYLSDLFVNFPVALLKGIE